MTDQIIKIQEIDIDPDNKYIVLLPEELRLNQDELKEFLMDEERHFMILFQSGCFL